MLPSSWQTSLLWIWSLRRKQFSIERGEDWVYQFFLTSTPFLDTKTELSSSTKRERLSTASKKKKISKKFYGKLHLTSSSEDGRKARRERGLILSSLHSPLLLQQLEPVLLPDLGTLGARLLRKLPVQDDPRCPCGQKELQNIHSSNARLQFQLGPTTPSASDWVGFAGPIGRGTI